MVGHHVRLRRIAVLAAAGLLTVANGFAAQAADDDSVTVGTKSEAWYVTPAHGACEGDTDCSTAPTSEFPRNTLHVGISNGIPTTATYIELDVLGANVPFGATFTEGHVVLPVDRNPGDGSVRRTRRNSVSARPVPSPTPRHRQPPHPTSTATLPPPTPVSQRSRPRPSGSTSHPSCAIGPRAHRPPSPSCPRPRPSRSPRPGT